MATVTHFFSDRSRVGEPIFPDLQFVTDVLYLQGYRTGRRSSSRTLSCLVDKLRPAPHRTGQYSLNCDRKTHILRVLCVRDRNPGFPHAR